MTPKAATANDATVTPRILAAQSSGPLAAGAMKTGLNPSDRVRRALGRFFVAELFAGDEQQHVSVSLAASSAKAFARGQDRVCCCVGQGMLDASWSMSLA